MTFNFKDSNRENSLNGNAINNKTKTTNVNVLLNSKIGSKKNFEKKYNSFSFVCWFNLFDCHLFYYLDYKSWLKVY